MPCPHHDIKIVQRSNRQSAVAAAAYQSGERLFSEYDQKQKYEECSYDVTLDGATLGAELGVTDRMYESADQ